MVITIYTPPSLTEEEQMKADAELLELIEEEWGELSSRNESPRSWSEALEEWLS